MGVEEFYGWVEYYKIEPWGSTIDGYRNASTTSTIANMGMCFLNNKEAKKNPFKLEQFLVGVDHEDNKTKKKTGRDGKHETAKMIRNAFMGIAKSKP